MTCEVPNPTARGPVPEAPGQHLFSTMRKARTPMAPEDWGYLEEEYFLSGTAHCYQPGDTTDDGPVPFGEAVPWTTRVLVRRPAPGRKAGPTAWVSVLNASQGYDIEDDWRRAWDWIVATGGTYVAVTAKPINADALQNFDPERYAALDWGGPLPGLAAEPGWNPFQVLPGSEEGLAWDVLSQTAAWVRSGEAFSAPERVFLTGQSQSAIYTNTYLSHFHGHHRIADGSHPYDGYLAGVGSVLSRHLVQGPAGTDTALEPVLAPVPDLDVPVIVVSSEGDVTLFGGDPRMFLQGDGPMRRHWHVAASPHSDPRSPVIPDNDEIIRARRLPRLVDADFLAGSSVVPLEPVVTAAMAALDRWVADGTPAAPSRWFEAEGPTFSRDETGGCRGGVRLGLVVHPLARFAGADPDNAVYGAMTLTPREGVLARHASLTDYLAACDEVDDVLEAQGYLEPHGRGLLRAVATELWERAVDGAPALSSTPQAIRPTTR